MDLRKQFVLAALAEGANISALCRHFGISRTNGYKWIARFRALGEDGLESQSRRPRRSVGLDGEVVLRILELSRRHRWGPKKLRQLLINGGETSVPSVKTIARVLQRAGEPRIRPPRRRIRFLVRQREVVSADAPNDLWTVDFKGWWRTRDGKRFEPLTVRDDFSRFILCLRMLKSTRSKDVQAVFEEIFAAHGLPAVIRVDNGSPFACVASPCGLSRLSAWWTALGIRVSFSRPAHPQDNGHHERMHADVAADLEADPSDSIEAQQHQADQWREIFNHVRPHEALGMRCPVELYHRSSRPFGSLREPRYPASFARRIVSRTGFVKYAGKALFISQSLRGHQVGIRRHGSRFALVHFYDLNLGSFELLAAAPYRAPALLTGNRAA